MGWLMTLKSRKLLRSVDSKFVVEVEYFEKFEWTHILSLELFSIYPNRSHIIILHTSFWLNMWWRLYLLNWKKNISILFRSKLLSSSKALATGNGSSSKSRNRKCLPHSSSSDPQSATSAKTVFALDFFNNISRGYDILLHTFQYLKVQVWPIVKHKILTIINVVDYIINLSKWMSPSISLTSGAVTRLTCVPHVESSGQ